MRSPRGPMLSVLEPVCGFPFQAPDPVQVNRAELVHLSSIDRYHLLDGFEDDIAQFLGCGSLKWPHPMRQRSASAWANVGRCAHRSSVSRSSLLSTTATVGQPSRVLMTLQRLPDTGKTPPRQHRTRLFVAFPTQDTR